MVHLQHEGLVAFGRVRTTGRILRQRPAEPAAQPRHTSSQRCSDAAAIASGTTCPTTQQRKRSAPRPAHADGSHADANGAVGAVGARQRRRRVRGSSSRKIVCEYISSTVNRHGLQFICTMHS